MKHMNHRQVKNSRVLFYIVLIGILLICTYEAWNYEQWQMPHNIIATLIICVVLIPLIWSIKELRKN